MTSPTNLKRVALRSRRFNFKVLKRAIWENR